MQGQAIYRFKDLKSATKNFCEDSKIGEGGFGAVYKVILYLRSLTTRKTAYNNDKMSEIFLTDVYARDVKSINFRHQLKSDVSKLLTHRC